nr:MAG TPA: hypothetical protein [Caudoviricetes sp.]
MLLYHVSYGWGKGHLSKFKRFSFVDIIGFLEASQVD